MIARSAAVPAITRQPMNRVKVWSFRLLLAGMARWPFGHASLVRVYGVNPWKLRGMAMYCAPKLRETATFFELMHRHNTPIQQPAADLGKAVNDYLREHPSLGQVASKRQLE